MRLYEVHCYFSGASGGSVINARGEIVGLITSNTRHTGSGRSFAKLNYSIAADTLRPILLALLHEELNSIKWSALDCLTKPERDAWQLTKIPELPPGSGKLRGAQRFKQLLRRPGMEDIEAASELAFTLGSRL